MTLRYDGTPTTGDHDLALTCGQDKATLYTRVLAPLPDGVPRESNRIVSIAPAAGTLTGDWQVIDGLGSLGRTVRARLDLPVRNVDGLAGVTPAAYPFATSTEVGGVLRVVALPTHALDPGKGVRVAVRLDGGPLQVLDFATLGRSDEWRENVLTNTAVREIALKRLTAGPHELRVYPLDPGVMLDRIEVDLYRVPYHYGALRPEVSQ